MPQEQENFQKSVNKVLEAAIFENWLRFYFIREKPEDKELYIELPPRSMDKIRELYPALLPLAQKLNNKPITFEASRDAVLEHVLREIDGKSIEKGAAQQILQSATFQKRLGLFHIWEQMHENQLDQGFMDFGSWLALFYKWLESPGADELRKRMLSEADGSQ